ncbi:MAG: hypothetical protein ICV64_00580 [Thermoleophilia bacterium]|nr:hypothetical protein [Thermoleophilia bacterium]
MTDEPRQQDERAQSEREGSSAQKREERPSAQDREEAPEGKRDGGDGGGLRMGELARDMGIGALAGAALGAVWRVAQVVQPERTEALKKSAGGAAREIASAAGAAAGNVVTSRPVNELLPTKLENGKRAEMMKSALKEAVAAAGDAAKDILEAKGKGEGQQKAGDGD